MIPLDSLTPTRRVAVVLAFLFALVSAFAMLIGGLLSASRVVFAIAIVLLITSFALPIARRFESRGSETMNRRRAYSGWLLVAAAAAGPVLAASGPSTLSLTGGILAGYILNLMVKEALRLMRRDADQGRPPPDPSPGD
jgi:hypothetical protein